MRTVKNLYRTDDTIFNDAFDRTVAEIHIKKQQNGYKTFLITGSESGVGSTTVAINLATSMALAGWKTILVDADMRKKTDDKRLNDEVGSGITEYLQNTASLDEIICDTSYDNLSYIASSETDAEAVSLVCSAELNKLLDALKYSYDYIIVDMPSINTAVDASVVATAVDATVMVTSRMKSDKSSLRKAYEQLNKVGANVIGVVVNNVATDEYKKVVANYDYYKNRKYKRKASK